MTHVRRQSRREDTFSPSPEPGLPYARYALMVGDAPCSSRPGVAVVELPRMTLDWHIIIFFSRMDWVVFAILCCRVT